MTTWKLSGGADYLIDAMLDPVPGTVNRDGGGHSVTYIDAFQQRFQKRAWLKHKERISCFAKRARI
jgi:hypothetical protein